MSTTPSDAWKAELHEPVTEVEIAALAHATSPSPEMQRIVRRLAFERDALKAIVDKLRKTEDGVPIVPGMKLWMFYLNDELDSYTVAEAGGCGRIYSTRAAAESAKDPR